MTTQSKISNLWIVLLFNMAFADIIGFAYPGALEEMMTLGTEGVSIGTAEGVIVTPGFLLVAAVFVEVAIVMIYLSRVLKANANRIANSVAAVLTAVFVIGGGSMKLHYIFFASIEIAILLVVVTLSWRLTDR